MDQRIDSLALVHSMIFLREKKMSHIVELPTGFQVRFNLRGRHYDSRHFTSQREAQAFLDSLSPEVTRRGVQANNTSGMPGIRLEWRLYKSDEPHAALTVSYRQRGRRRNTSISLNKHGVGGALRKALAPRGESDKLTEYLPLVKRALRG